ncbi:hypothetical protein BEL01nite_85920 [Bradyrhizobium elkanii]|nr:hypothetical protein BEL01nite_85920 [Bradyrhizobium elkanii]
MPDFDEWNGAYGRDSVDKAPRLRDYDDKFDSAFSQSPQRKAVILDRYNPPFPRPNRPRDEP